MSTLESEPCSSCSSPPVSVENGVPNIVAETNTTNDQVILISNDETDPDCSSSSVSDNESLPPNDATVWTWDDILNLASKVAEEYNQSPWTPDSEPSSSYSSPPVSVENSVPNIVAETNATIDQVISDDDTDPDCNSSNVFDDESLPPKAAAVGSCNDKAKNPQNNNCTRVPNKSVEKISDETDSWPVNGNCCYVSCVNKRYQIPGVTLFKFPTDSRLGKWLENCGLRHLIRNSTEEQSMELKLCPLHFEQKYIKRRPCREIILLDTAIPTIF